MGRTATFDRETALTQARDLFWEQGYAGAAVPDLEQATGLRRSSLYHAFGSKKELFDLTIQHYLDTVVRPLLTEITASDAPPAALQTYFEKVAGAIQSTDRHPGCLLIAAANAPIGQDPAVQAAITGYHGELEKAFFAGLRTARPGVSASDAKEQARVLVALNVSALALAKTDRSLALANLLAAQKLAAPATS